MQQRIDKVNAQLASYETIKSSRSWTRPLTVEGGMLTPTLKVRRKKVYEAFGAELRGSLRMKRLFNLASLAHAQASAGRARRRRTSCTPRTSGASSATAGSTPARLRRRRSSSCRRSSTGTTCSTCSPARASPSGSSRAGHDVYCIDWGTPADEDRYLTFDDVCDALPRRARSRKTGAPKAHVLGYCMGGTLAAIHASVHPERFASLVALAAPVRFAEAGLLGVVDAVGRVRAAGSLVEALGNVPWQLLQSSFHMLRPTLNLAKAVHLVDRAWDDEFLDGFLAIETWGNDNVELPGRGLAARGSRSSTARTPSSRGTFALSGKPGAPREHRRARCSSSPSSTTASCRRPARRTLVERVASRDKQHASPVGRARRRGGLARRSEEAVARAIGVLGGARGGATDREGGGNDRCAVQA